MWEDAKPIVAPGAGTNQLRESHSMKPDKTERHPNASKPTQPAREPVAMNEIPQPPPGFSVPKSQRPIYDMIARHLIQHRALTAIDAIAISNATAAYYRMIAAQKKLKTKGDIQTYANKTTNKSAELTAYESHLATWRKYEDELGMTPKAREKMHRTFTVKKGKAKSALRDMLNSKPK